LYRCCVLFVVVLYLLCCCIGCIVRYRQSHLVESNPV
jgi:hypothetical protein